MCMRARTCVYVCVRARVCVVRARDLYVSINTHTYIYPK